jgi:hypothetical protein
MEATLFLGAGPAGLGPLVFAAQCDRLGPWLDHGVTVVERRPAASSVLSRYALFADSFGSAFLEASEADGAHAFLSRVRASREAAMLHPYRDARPPLEVVGAYLARTEAELEKEVRAHPRCAFLRGREIVALHLHPDRVEVEHRAANDPATERCAARTAVVALGGCQTLGQAAAAGLGHAGSLGALAEGRLVHADHVLTEEGIKEALSRLAAATRPEVVVVGTSHSAFSVAWLLSQRAPSGLLGTGAITLLGRSLPRVFYRSPEEAHADGYDSFTSDDVCPRTRRVHQLGGLRGDGRELYRQMTRRPGTQAERRVRLDVCSSDVSAEGIARLRRATLVVAALGYRPRMPPVLRGGAAVALRAEAGGPSVDDRCRLLSADGSPIERVFSLGLASGFVPSGEMGGEPSFRGHTNGVWLYQHHIGARVHRGIHEVLAGMGGADGA